MARKGRKAMVDSLDGKAEGRDNLNRRLNCESNANSVAFFIRAGYRREEP